MAAVGLFEIAASVAGGGLIVAALLCKRLNRALALLFAGSLTLAIDIAALAGFASGVIVAALYAGALVAMILVWLMLLEEEKTRVDAIYLASVALAAASGLLLLPRGAALLGGGAPEPWSPGLLDVGSLMLVLAAASIGVVHILGGDAE